MRRYRIVNIWKCFPELSSSATKGLARLLNDVFETRGGDVVVDVAADGLHFCSAFTRQKDDTRPGCSFLVEAQQHGDFDRGIGIGIAGAKTSPFRPIQCAQAFQTFRLISTLRFSRSS